MEIRISKYETNSKYKIPKGEGISDFGFRASDLIARVEGRGIRV
jgi:hypothetical protein